MRTLQVLALLALLTASAHADLVVVDPHGGDGAALLQAAVDAAQDGDVLLLKAGDYVGAGLPALHIAGRSLTLVADDGLAPLPIRSTNVDGGDHGVIVLRGLRMATPQEDDMGVHHAGSLDVASQALCWVEDCEVLGTPDVVYGTNGIGLAGLVLSGSAVAVRSHFTGCMSNVALLDQGGDAIHAQYASLSLFDCTAVGGDGKTTDSIFALPGNGGGGLYAEISNVMASGCSLQGGAEPADNTKPATSGPGLSLIFAVSEGWLRGCSVMAGAVQGAVGTQGPDLVNPAQDIDTFVAAPRSLAVPRLCREGSHVVLSLHGVQGDLVGLMLSTSAAWQAPIPSRQGPLLLDVSGLVGPLVVGGISAADGSLDLSFDVPRLPAGLDVQLLFAQGLFVGSDGATLGSGSAFCWIAKDA